MSNCSYAQNSEVCPRLIDYIIFIGSHNPNLHNCTTRTPQILRRYPLSDHKDFPLPPDVTVFCQPDGCVHVSHKRSVFRNMSNFIFTLTDKDSAKVMYAVCVSFFRYVGSYKNDSNAPEQTDQKSPDDNGTNKSKVPLRKYALTSLCLISHHPFISNFRRCLMVLKNIIDRSNRRAKKAGVSNVNAQRETVWQVITGQCLSNISSIVADEIRGIETWIFHLLNTPIPVRGKTKIHVVLLPSEPALIFAIPDKTRLSFIDIPLHLPMELLGIDLCIKVLTLIILEQKVLIQSKDYNALTMSVLGLIYLMYPLQYMFPVIPLLPSFLNCAEQLLLAPTPFVIGIGSGFMQFRPSFRIPDDVWLVNLDCSQVIPPINASSIPELPFTEGQFLRKSFQQILSRLNSSGQSNKTSNKNSETLKLKESLYGNMPELSCESEPDAVDVAIRVVMVLFFNSPNLLRNFNEHTRTLRLYPRPVVAFQTNSFIHSRPTRSEFLIKLARTQAIEYYAEWLLCPSDQAFLRIQTGVFDPALIGDKVKWYGQNLTSVRFEIAEGFSRLLESNGQDADFSVGVSDESDGADDSDDMNSQDVFSWPFDSAFVHCDSDVCIEDDAADTSSPEKREQISFVNQASIYVTPSNLELPAESSRSDSELTASLSSSSLITSSLSSSNISSPESDRYTDEIATEQTESNSSGEMSLVKKFPRLLKELSAKNFAPPSKQCSVNSSPGDSVFSVDSKKANNQSRLFGIQKDISFSDYFDTSSISSLLHSFIEGHKRSRSQSPNRIVPSLNDEDADVNLHESKIPDLNERNSDRMFLTNVINTVLEGKRIAWLSSKRLRELMKNESYRNYVLSRFNTNLDKKHSREDDVISDIKLKKDVFRSMLKVLLMIVQGLEFTYETYGTGGVASAYQLLEICHTHYYSLAGDSPLPTAASMREAFSHLSSVTLTGGISKNFTSPGKLESNLSRTDSTASSDELNKASTPQTKVQERRYLYEYLNEDGVRSAIWDQMQFWEDTFVDAVAQERDMIGLDQGPSEMISRYNSLSVIERRRLEREEDKLLAFILCNLIAFMVMMKVKPKDIKQKVRRILGRCHIGLAMSQCVAETLDKVADGSGNGIHLRPFGSRLMQKQTFTVHCGTSAMGSVMFLEVYEDSLVLRNMQGEIYDRVWFDKLLNVSFSSKSKVLCLWKKFESETVLNKYYTKRCKELYSCIKDSVEKAATKKSNEVERENISGGEFEIFDESKGKGTIKINLEGVTMKFGDTEEFIDLTKIKKLTMEKSNLLMLEEYDSSLKKTRTRVFQSPMAASICNSFITVCSYLTVEAKEKE